jgi:ornithine cyclodeaminase/alanine dehydrogenase-like protein (mu-crystallin family)
MFVNTRSETQSLSGILDSFLPTSQRDIISTGISNGSQRENTVPLLLSEADVKSLLTMPLAIEAVENSFRRLGEGAALVHSRQRLHLPSKSYLHYMAAADGVSGYMGLKIYTSSGKGLRFLVTLFSAESGDLVALIEADFLGQMRTGAASGVATRYLARENARTLGMVGTGLQARTQLQAIAQIRKLAEIRVFGRDAGRREKFAKEMSDVLMIPVTAVTSGEDAVRDADIVVTSTTSAAPVLEGKWLKPGVHINAIGANFPQKRELDAEAVGRCNLIVVDSRAQSKLESGDLIQAFGEDGARWTDVRELAEIVTGKVAGRTSPNEITLFKSNGIATEDVVVAGRIFEIAREREVGREVPMWQQGSAFEKRTEVRK